MKKVKRTVTIECINFLPMDFTVPYEVRLKTLEIERKIYKKETLTDCVTEPNVLKEIAQNTLKMWLGIDSLEGAIRQVSFSPDEYPGEYYVKIDLDVKSDKYRDGIIKYGSTHSIIDVFIVHEKI